MPEGTTAATQPMMTGSWRSIYPIHPCADIFPMMSDAEIDALADDIKAHGLQQPVVLWEAPKVPRTPATYFVLDGRNRLEALARLGIEIPAPDYPRETVDLPGGRIVCVFAVANNTEHESPQVQDPAEFVIGANIRRRHLTKEAQAELIVKAIEAGTIDCATVARSFNPTSGKKGGSTKDPVLEKSVNEAAKHGISKRTVQNARAKLLGKPTAARRPRSQKLPLASVTAQPAAPTPASSTTGANPVATPTSSLAPAPIAFSTSATEVITNLEDHLSAFVTRVEVWLAGTLEGRAQYTDDQCRSLEALLKDLWIRLDKLASQVDEVRDAVTAARSV